MNYNQKYADVPRTDSQREYIKEGETLLDEGWYVHADVCADLERELLAIKKEAETNQKWAFLTWRERAENAETRVMELESIVEELITELELVNRG